MYKLCVALAALLAVAAARPGLGLGYSYGPYVAPVAAAYSAPLYSNYAPVAAVSAPISYAAAPAYAASYPAYSGYSAYSGFPAYSGYSSYPLAYASDYSAPFLWKKK